jgi:hypothetical protein
MSLDAGSPEAWLRYARSDLALAGQSASADVLREALAFHAQQAAERSIKAVLVHFAVPFPKPGLFMVSSSRARIAATSSMNNPRATACGSCSSHPDDARRSMSNPGKTHSTGKQGQVISLD